LFFKGHNFAFGWHCKFGVESGEKLGQLRILLFISAMKTRTFLDVPAQTIGKNIGRPS
jgi:hypothetical protein